MREAYMISSEAQGVIKEFINALSSSEHLHPKTLIEYAGDLKHFINWFEVSAYYSCSQSASIIFRLENVAELTLTNYREEIQTIMCLKPATINRRLTTLKRFFEWAAKQNIITLDPSKHIKLLPSEKVTPRQMTDKEEAELIASVEQYGTLRDQTILIIMLHTGLCTMEVCDLAPRDITVEKHQEHVTVRSGKRNKQRKVPLNPISLTALERYLSELPTDSLYLFPSEKTKERLCERALRYIIQKYMKHAQLEELSAHDLRHRFGYKMAENLPPQQLAQIMGLDNTETTMVYVNAARKDLIMNH